MSREVYELRDSTTDIYLQQTVCAVVGSTLTRAFLSSIVGMVADGKTFIPAVRGVRAIRSAGSDIERRVAEY
jgi:hypothetical protein